MRFLLVDRIVAMEPGRFARGVKAVSGSEDFFADHFPGNPVFPGVLILEAMAQTGGVLLALETDCVQFALMTLVENAKFRWYARPGDMLELEVEVLARDEGTARTSAVARVAGREIASARFAYVLVPLEQVVGARYVGGWRDQVRAWAAGAELRADRSTP